MVFRFFAASGIQRSGPVASVVIVHGLGEHSGRYVHVGRYFAEAGIRTIAFDLRGHGRSPGRPVFVNRYVELASDVDCVVKHFSGGPTFLFGHSLGGQLVLWTAQHFRLQYRWIDCERSLVGARVCAA